MLALYTLEEDSDISDDATSLFPYQPQLHL